MLCNVLIESCSWSLDLTVLESKRQLVSRRRTDQTRRAQIAQENGKHFNLKFSNTSNVLNDVICLQHVNFHLFAQPGQTVTIQSLQNTSLNVLSLT